MFPHWLHENPPDEGMARALRWLWWPGYQTRMLKLVTVMEMSHFMPFQMHHRKWQRTNILQYASGRCRDVAFQPTGIYINKTGDKSLHTATHTRHHQAVTTKGQVTGKTLCGSHGANVLPGAGMPSMIYYLKDATLISLYVKMAQG